MCVVGSLCCLFCANRKMLSSSPLIQPCKLHLPIVITRLGLLTFPCVSPLCSSSITLCIPSTGC